jgi:predicted Kef-type K+ transport protein
MNVDWQGKPKFSEKTCPSATFVHHKIPHDQNRAAAVGSRQLTALAALAMALPVNAMNAILLRHLM